MCIASIGEIIGDTFFALLGALAGVVIGVWFNERKADEAQWKEKQRLKAKLIDSFRFNLGEIKKMNAMLQGQPITVPDFRLDSESVGHILFHGQDLFEEAWFRKFDWERYQLMHINAKVDFLNAIVNLGGQSVPPEVIQQRYGSLVASLGIVSTSITKLLEEYARYHEERWVL
jgi:hypothetical protein